MKKIFAFTLAVLLAFSLCGCMRNPNTAKIPQVTDPAEDTKIEAKDYEDTLDGLCAYFADLGYAFPTSGDEIEAVVMDADIIGADAGYKFTYTYGGDQVTLELYSYSDTDNQFYKQAKSEGKITVAEDLEQGTVDVTLSDNGKYLMIYNAEEENEERENAIKEAFVGFHS
ncbi:MAG: hypothetical protein IJV88_02520 [Ruminococcus sp.]|nr:hypothetical protein [Ruminococcus sp.]